MELKEKINPRNLSDDAYNILAKKIISGKLKAGVKLIESKLANNFGISRTPIREALNRLAQDGLIELIPKKGAQVSLLKAKDVEEIYDVRKALEGMATKEATPLIKEKDLKQIAKLIEKCDSSPERRLKYFLESDLKLHRLIIERSGNGRLTKILQKLNNFINSFRVFDAQYDQRVKDAREEHKNILRALIKKDAKKARALVEQHIENAKKNILADFEFKERGAQK